MGTTDVGRLGTSGKTASMKNTILDLHEMIMEGRKKIVLKPGLSLDQDIMDEYVKPMKLMIEERGGSFEYIHGARSLHITLFSKSYMVKIQDEIPMAFLRLCFDTVEQILRMISLDIIIEEEQARKLNE